MDTERPIHRDRHSSRRIDDAVAYRLHRTNRLLLTHLSRVLAEGEVPLTPERWFVLARIFADEPVRQVDLTDPTLGDPPNVSRLVDALVRDGLVERRTDPRDGRGRVLRLTAHGAEVAASRLDAAVPLRHELFGGIDDDRLQVFVEVLDQLEVRVRAVLDASEGGDD